MKKKVYLNIIFTILCQVISIACGLIVPRLLLSAFGSEANGLVSSLTQFLNYISLLEGGLGSVVLTALYSPLALENNEKLSSVLKSANVFFRQIAYFFIAYVFVLGCVYSSIVKTNYSWIFVFILTIVLALSLFIQYFFSITYKLLLQADQKMYIVQIVQIIITVMNLAVVCIVIKIFPNLHILKLCSALLFVLQPIIYSKYVEKKYEINKNARPDKDALAQRWDCFGQNFAFFIHNNTDTVVLSLFTNLKLVSVYSVYFLVVNNIKNFFLSFSNAFTPMIGKAIAKKDKDMAIKVLDIYEFIVFFVATIVFGCCIYLLPDFILIYTKGINDVNYYRPYFSIILVLAEAVYCIREPYIAVVYSAGGFKETAISAYIEAAINIVLSVVFVFMFGLEGIAIGTLIAMAFRMLYQVIYISKHILFRPVIFFVKRIFVSGLITIVSLFIVNGIDNTHCYSLSHWVKNGIISVMVFLVVSIVLNLIFDRKLFGQVYTKLLGRRAQK